MDIAVVPDKIDWFAVEADSYLKKLMSAVAGTSGPGL
jgi:hypothetical protein